MNVRVIPRLDIKGPNLVKGIHLEGLRVLGKPERFAEQYYGEGADELVYVDAVASLYQRNSLLDLVSRTSEAIFIPLTVGGGLRTLEDIRAALRSGADKVALNTAAIARPELIREASRSFGSSTVVVSIEAIRKPSGKWEAYTDNGREETGVSAVDWAKRVAELGAGEILLTSIDREGTGRGYDIELVRQVSEGVPIPVIASGGAGTAGHIRDVILDGRADAVCVASMLHYHSVKQDVHLEEYSGEGNVEYIKARPYETKLETLSLPEIKAFLIESGVPCRLGSQGESVQVG
jgi:cyclase